jgi:hypothetical protein
LYFTEKMPVYKIGKKVGLQNFGAIIRQQRKRGWDVPPPLFVYRGKGEGQDREGGPPVKAEGAKERECRNSSNLLKSC